jgi:transposase
MMNGSDLPDGIDALKAMILASQAELVGRDGIIERKEDCIRRLEKLVADFKRALFGARSEKAAPDQYELALEDIETALSVMQSIT